MIDDDLLPAGAVVGRYVIEGMLGQGGMAAVYKVRHQQLNTLHALKMLTVPGRRIRKRLVQEGRVQAALHHPNIVAVTDILEHENQPGLVMEYVDGPTLEQLLAAYRMNLDQVDVVARGILRGVQAAHATGLIHRDLKPANVLIALDGDRLLPKVTDFGLAKLQGDKGPGHTRSGDTMGTPAYMAPEAIQNAKHVDHRADVFSMGALLYELVTGVRCFQRDDILQTFTAVVNADYPPVRELAPNTPDRMVQTIEAALDPNPSTRISSIGALLERWDDQASPIDAAGRSVPLFDPELIAHVKSLGAGQESMSAVLSGRTAVPPSEASDTPAPAPRDTLVSLYSIGDSPETYTDEGVLPPRPSEDTVLLADPPAPAPVPAPAALPEPAPAVRRHLVPMGLALGLATAATVVLVGVGVAVVGASGQPAPPGPSASIDPPHLPSPIQEPEPSPAPDGAAALDPDEGPSGSTGGATAPVVPPPRPEKPTPQAAAPTPSPVAPAAPAIEPSPEAPADPEGTAGADAPGPDAAFARFAVTGDVRVMLIRAGGGNYEEGEDMPPGTYDIAAYFGDDTPRKVKTGVVLHAGQRLAIRCDMGMKSCL